MISSPLALSLTNSLAKFDAIAAAVALVGIAILSLLVFAQAREIKRLREWAGRAPERAAEQEQRVSTQAAARVAGVQPVAGARTVPRTTPLNVRAAAATGPATRVAPGVAIPVSAAALSTGTGPDVTQTPATTPPAVAQQGQASTTAHGPGTDAQAPAPTKQDDPPASTPTPVPTAEAESQPQSATEQDTKAPGAEDVVASPQSDAQPQDSKPVESQAPTGDDQEPALTPGPSTAAARAARSPLPPAPGGGLENREHSEPNLPVSGSSPVRPADSPPRPSARPPADVIAAARRTGAPGPNAPSAQRRTAPSGPSRPDSYKFLTDEDRRSPARTAIAILAGVVLVGVLAVVAISSLGKGGPTHSSTSTQTGTTTSSKHSKSTRHHTATAAISSPATVALSVLNGTETTNLAHDLARHLSEKGYTRAEPLDGHPPGTYPKTVVEYAGGHSADARNIARLLGITSSEVQPINEATEGLAKGAVVVVIAGVDEATRASNAGETAAVPSEGSSASGGESSENAGGQ